MGCMISCFKKRYVSLAFVLALTLLGCKADQTQASASLKADILCFGGDSTFADSSAIWTKMFGDLRIVNSNEMASMNSLEIKNTGEIRFITGDSIHAFRIGYAAVNMRFVFYRDKEVFVLSTPCSPRNHVCAELVRRGLADSAAINSFYAKISPEVIKSIAENESLRVKSVKFQNFPPNK